LSQQQSNALIRARRWLAHAYPRANDGFVQGMRELGYVNEKDYVIEWRSVEGNYERIPEIAAEFVRLKVDVIVTALGAALPTLQRAITTIPIVMATSTDPVGNVVEPSTAGWQHDRTGSSADDSSPKQLELLATIVPNISRMGLLGNPSNTTSSPVLKGAQDAARAAKISTLAPPSRRGLALRGDKPLISDA